MSYDLYLSSPHLDGDAFARYFEGREHYEGFGWYANHDTGVYFNFDFVEPDANETADPEAPEIVRAPHAAFNLNFFRPHVFGLEAAPEVAAFVAAFDCSVLDPQTDGMGEGPFSTEGFLRGWNKGNAHGYEAIGSEVGTDDMLIAEDALIHRVWEWNLRREASQQSFGESRFLPLVNWAKRLSDGSPIAFAVWGEGVVTAFPECATHVVLARDPRRRLAALFGAKQGELETKLVPIKELVALGGCGWRETDVGRVLLAPTEIPPSDAIRATFKDHFGGIDSVAKPFAFDHVLNASLMAKVSG